MGEPAYFTPDEVRKFMLIAARIFDAVNNDEEIELPDKETIICIMIQFARLTGIRLGENV